MIAIIVKVMSKIGNKTITQKITFSRSVGKRTSIGRSSSTRPKNRDARRQHKRYRGQGFPLRRKIMFTVGLVIGLVVGFAACAFLAHHKPEWFAKVVAVGNQAADAINQQAKKL